MLAGTLERGASVTVTLVLKATAAGRIDNRATVAHGHEPDPDLANNTASATTKVSAG